MTPPKGRPNKRHTAPAAPTYTAPAAPAALAAPTDGPVENGQRLATFARGMSEELRVNWSQYNGHHFIALRVWHCGVDGKYRPDRARGCTVKLRELEEFSRAIQAAVEMATAHG